jgi:Plant mobile domain
MQVVDRAAQFVLMLDALNTDQRQKISDLRLDCLFKLHPILISRSLIDMLAKKYEPDTQTFKFGTNNISLTNRDAFLIMGFRNKGIRVNLDERCPNENLIDIFENPITQNISFSDLKSRILNMSADDEDFMRVFVLLMVAGLLAQPIDDRIPHVYINIVEDVMQISNFNWADFTVSFLHRSLKRHKIQNVYLEGNFILLQVTLYLEICI